MEFSRQRILEWAAISYSRGPSRPRDWTSSLESPALAGWFFTTNTTCCCSVTKSCPALQSHGLQHTRLPCSSLSHGVCSNLYPSSWWCHPTISSSVIPFSSHLQSYPASESFQMSQFFASGGQNIVVSASVFPMNIQDWFSLGWTGWISLQSQELSSCPTPQFKSIISSALSFLYIQHLLTANLNGLGEFICQNI